MRIKRFILREEKGFSILEVIIAILILAMISVGLFSTMANVSKSTTDVDVKQAAGTLAASLMEVVKRQSSAPAYTPDTTVMNQYKAYTANITVASIPSRDSLIQKITVTVDYNSKTLATLEGYKLLK